MWLVSCRRQGLLTQGPAPDSKCKLNISSFLTLPYPLDCFNCAKDIMIIVLLLEMMGDGKVGAGGGVHRGGSFMLGLVCRTGCERHSFSVFCFVFVLLLIVLSWLLNDSCCVFFIASVLLFFFFFVSGL